MQKSIIGKLLRWLILLLDLMLLVQHVKLGQGAYGLAGIQGVSENSFFCSRELDSGFIQGFGYAYRSGDGCKEGAVI